MGDWSGRVSNIFSIFDNYGNLNTTEEVIIYDYNIDFDENYIVTIPEVTPNNFTVLTLTIPRFLKKCKIYSLLFR
jgi:hypothetical protein